MNSILLLSDKSSGSTAFQYEVARHPDVSLLNETDHNDHESLYWLKVACAFNRNKADYYQSKVPYSRNEALEQIARLAELNTGRGRRVESLADAGRLWDEIVEKHEGILFEKSPHHLNNWAASLALMHYVQARRDQVRIIGLVRNPCAVVYSTWDRWASEIQTRQFLWAATQRNLLALKAALPDECVFLVRYEDLIAEPVEQFAKVQSFLGLQHSSLLGTGIHDRSRSKWLEDESFAFELDPSVKTLAESFGYSEEDLHIPPRPAPDRLEVLSRQLRQRARRAKHDIARLVRNR